MRRRRLLQGTGIGLAALAARQGEAAKMDIYRVPGPATPRPIEPLSALERRTATELRRDVQTLAGEIGLRSARDPEGLRRAADLLARALADAGYVVDRQGYDAGGHTAVNVEGALLGKKRPEEILVVGAHYDAVAGTVGANDNGSGVAATLALARRFAGRPGARTLRFVFFAHEEPPHFQTDRMGSLVYARRCRARKEAIVGMLSLETIGYYSRAPGSQRYPEPVARLFPSVGNFIGFASDPRSRPLLVAAVDGFRAATPFPVEGAALPAEIPGVGWSDHWAFWQAGYQALIVTDTAPFRYPHYHTPADTPDKLDYDAMARVVTGLEGAISALLSPR
jgi:hypothetical protein